MEEEAGRIMSLRFTSPGPDSPTSGWNSRVTNAATVQDKKTTTITNENILDRSYRTHTRMKSTTVFQYQWVRRELNDKGLAINRDKVDLKTY
jgi:hypothetical protein